MALPTSPWTLVPSHRAVGSGRRAGCALADPLQALCHLAAGTGLHLRAELQRGWGGSVPKQGHNGADREASSSPLFLITRSLAGTWGQQSPPRQPLFYWGCIRSWCTQRCQHPAALCWPQAALMPPDPSPLGPVSPSLLLALSTAPALSSTITVTLSPGCGAGAAARQGRAVSGAAMVSSSPRGLGGSSRAPLRFGGQH